MTLLQSSKQLPVFIFYSYSAKLLLCYNFVPSVDGVTLVENVKILVVFCTSACLLTCMLLNYSNSAVSMFIFFVIVICTCCLYMCVSYTFVV